MKQRGVLAVLGALAIAFIAQPRGAAEPLILSKDAVGHILPGVVSLELKSNPDCDQTAPLIPDGSKLVSEKFALNVDDKGIGFFNGPVKIITLDGKTVIVGMLHGTVGLTVGPTDATKTCLLPGRLEGMLTGALAPQPGGTTSSTDPNGVVTEPLEVNFQADQVQESAGIVPLYRARLAGLLSPIPPPPPPVPQLKVMAERPFYAPTDTITAIIANGPAPVRILDEQSVCTIVQLQREDGANWILESGCPLDRMPIATILKAGEVRIVPLVRNAAWIAGRYRLAVTFAPIDSTGQPASPDQTVVSEPFVVASPPTVPAVTLTSDRKAYTVNQPIIATIANGSTFDVMTWDHRSFCTVVNLQKQQTGGWKSIAPCALMSPTMPVIIKAGQKLVVPLPGGPATNTAKWEPGMYRLQAVFGTPIGAGVPGVVFEVVSDSFTVAIATFGIVPVPVEVAPTPVK